MFSPEFKNFISFALTKEPRYRPGANELLGHPWIINNLQKAHLYMEWVNKMN